MTAPFGDHNVITVSMLKPRDIFNYNRHSGLWRKCVIPASHPAPRARSGADFAVIGGDIYLFGGLFKNFSRTNDLWKLTLNVKGCYQWIEIKVKEKSQSPCPRASHLVWEYDGKLWSYGGNADAHDGYLNNYGRFRAIDEFHFAIEQTVCFDPETKQWTDVQFSGTMPEASDSLAGVRINNTLWIFYLEDLYNLDLSSLQWRKVTMGNPKPSSRNFCSLTKIGEDAIVLHGGMPSNFPYAVVLSDNVWYLNLSSMTWSQKPSDNVTVDDILPKEERLNYVLTVWGWTEIRGNVNSLRPLCQARRVKTLQDIALTCIDKHRRSLPLNALPKALQEKILLPGEKSLAPLGTRNK